MAEDAFERIVSETQQFVWSRCWTDEDLQAVRAEVSEDLAFGLRWLPMQDRGADGVEWSVFIVAEVSTGSPSRLEIKTAVPLDYADEQGEVVVTYARMTPDERQALQDVWPQFIAAMRRPEMLAEAVKRAIDAGAEVEG